jgi:hypothetical protein
VDAYVYANIYNKRIKSTSPFTQIRLWRRRRGKGLAKSGRKKNHFLSANRQKKFVFNVIFVVEGASDAKTSETRAGSGMVQLVGGKKEVEKMKREKKKVFIVCLVCVSGSVVI